MSKTLSFGILVAKSWKFKNLLENLLARACERPKGKDTSVSDFVERTVGSSAKDLKTNNSR